MTGMEHAIEQAAEVVAKRFHETYERLAPEFSYQTREASAKPWEDVPEQNKALMVAVCTELLAAGLSAPAPLREEWGSEMRDVRLDRDPYVLYARGPGHAQWQIEHNPEWATGRIMHRYRTDWMPVNRAEGDGRGDQ